MRQACLRYNKDVNRKLTPLSLSFAALLLAAAALPHTSISHAGGQQSQVWRGDDKTLASLRPEASFDGYLIRLPEDFVETRAASYDDGTRTEWHGEARPDGTHPAMSVTITQITREQAEQGPVEIGVQTLEQSGRASASKYTRTKSEDGLIDGVDWATRFYDTATVTPRNDDAAAKNYAPLPTVTLRAVNYAWLDNSKLILVTAYDALPYASRTLPLMEASACTIRAVPAPKPQ